ncbi:LysR substrate-binding domain-containing protein [Cupriavidus taiwanensis]|uniref:LysR substrate-binding domain-containing protein n=1 Tax=Cupriavidus taiwanensis TaxID=164546 RepID=UPI000E13BB6A|nr:LysR substrate-binding domain-containing protein [Cupriavidus taiwanensis]SOZ29564.1 putative transcriptional regulator, LysR family [Cupriavidus taiwanensis]SPA34399.1 putative transcriptional regulator, LysR family [Cupriavidus taiwanensis]
MKSTLETVMGRLRVKQLQLLIALDEHASLHQAAAAMAMTQSAASKSLQELESMLEASLFERSRRGMRPNAFGHCVIRHARQLVADLGAMCDEVAGIRAGSGGRVAVGTIMGAVPEVLVPALAQLRQAHPELALEVIEDTSRRLLELLDDGHLDLVIGRSLVSDEPARYHYHALGDEQVAVVVGRSHPAPRTAAMGFAGLAGYRWITYAGHMPMHALLQRELDLAGMGFPANAVSTSSAFVTVAMLQGDPRLVSLLPAGVAAMFERQKMLRILPVRLQSRQQTFGIVTRRGGGLSAAARQLVAILKAGPRGAGATQAKV